MRDHTKLRAFVLADEMAVLIYEMTRRFPREEMFGLTSQMRRAVVSIPSNIVEGSARESQTEYVRFLEIAFGSLKELHYQYSLVDRLGYLKEINSSEFATKFLELEKVLGGLIRALRIKGRGGERMLAVNL